MNQQDCSCNGWKAVARLTAIGAVILSIVVAMAAWDIASGITANRVCRRYFGHMVSERSAVAYNKGTESCETTTTFMTGTNDAHINRRSE